MGEGVSEGSRSGKGRVTFSSISCRHLSRNIYVLLECLVFHCMSTKVGSNPCRIIPLLGIAHPVKGKIISGTEGSPGDGTHPRP